MGFGVASIELAVREVFGIQLDSGSSVRPVDRLDKTEGQVDAG